MTLTGTTRSTPLIDAAGLVAMSDAGMSALDRGRVGGPGMIIRASREVTGPFGPGGRPASVRAPHHYTINRPNEELAAP